MISEDRLKEIMESKTGEEALALVEKMRIEFPKAMHKLCEDIKELYRFC